MEHARRAWDRAEAGWQERERVVLFDEAARVLTRAVHDWAGVPLPDGEEETAARDLVAMVDGFAAVGPGTCAPGGPGRGRRSGSPR